jgi:DNA-directed RNA polymerase specialized sigma24 family protein
MAVAALENLRRLAAHHLPEMAGEHKRALLLQADGKLYEQIAALERVSVGTVKNRLAVAASEIAMCLAGEQLSPAMKCAWIGAHWPCCLEQEAEKLRRRGS